MVCLDIEAAFDKVPHNFLLFKLYEKGYPDWMLSFLNSYFSARCFQIKVGDIVSSLHPIMTGSPQGSNLSAFLYNYISDMPTPPLTLGITSQYADDGRLLHYLQPGLPDGGSRHANPDGPSGRVVR